MDSKYHFLNKIDSPDDLKKLKKKDLPTLCEELRDFIVNEVSKNPAHFGSSLGVIELTVALHYVFKTPYDKIVWDVGHQAYGHKILTGRRDVFHTNRQWKGISGFPKIKESEYDAFGVGHASTSISAALGMSVASLLKSENRRIVAVIGDGAMTGGLAFEGLNNTSMSRNNLLIILNDNQMAIDPIEGGFTQYLVDITTSKMYNKIRHRLYNFFKKQNFINDKRKNKIIRFNNSIKTAITQQKEHNIFEGLNIRYLGPVNGHDVLHLIKILDEIKDHQGPMVLHCITKKGRGYKPAEESATGWHAPGAFDVITGEKITNSPTHKTPPLYQEVFGETLLELAKQNNKIVGITPAMPSGCSMTIMQNELPKRVFDVGIAEGHAVTFSAGLAKEGIIPFCNIYSTFMQRAYDNVVHDVALQELPVIMCLDRAGIVGADGATHHGEFDLAYFRPIPNLTIVAPRNAEELRNLMFTAQLPNKGAFVIRYPRGRSTQTQWRNPFKEIKIGKGECLKVGKKYCVITIGTIANSVEKAINNIENNHDGVNIAHYHARFLKPIDKTMLHEIAKKYTKIVTAEEGVIKGGLGSAVLEFLSENNYNIPLKRIGIADEFIEHGTTQDILSAIELDIQGIEKQIKKYFSIQKTE